jgi:hypothetical protein
MGWRARGTSTDEFITHLDKARLPLYTPAQVVAGAQVLVRRYVRERRSLSGDLISERREEAAREWGDAGRPGSPRAVR